MTVGLYPGDPAITVPLLEVGLDNVCGGCSGRADFELTLPAGTYEYVISVSADAGVVEKDFDNNDKPCTFTVAPGMIQGLDLEVTQSGIVFSPVPSAGRRTYTRISRHPQSGRCCGPGCRS